MQIRQLYLLSKWVRKGDNMTSISDEVRKIFEDECYHQVNEIICRIKNQDKSAKDESIKRAIRRLRSSESIYKITNDIYAKGHKKHFIPFNTNKIVTMNNFINKEYPDVNVLIWDTEILKPFSHNYFNINYKIVEVEKGFEETIFEHLSSKYKKVFLNPTEKEYDKYVFHDECIVVKSKVLRAPKVEIGNLETAKLEKIIVDTLIDENAFSWLKGKELERLILNIIENYEVDLTTLFQYAQYRNKESFVKKTLFNYSEKVKSNDFTIYFLQHCLDSYTSDRKSKINIKNSSSNCQYNTLSSETCTYTCPNKKQGESNDKGN